MTSKTVQQRLAKLGFEYDESVTFKSPSWGDWQGTIDPIGKMRIGANNECSGRVVGGRTRAEMDSEAIAYAQWASPHLVPCTDPHCPMHEEE